MENGTLQVSTINKIFARIKTVVNQAFWNGKIPLPHSPAALVRDLEVPEKEIDPFSVDEFLRILAACKSEQQRTLYILLGLSGLRPAEALGLPWGNLNFQNGLVAVRQQLVDGESTERLKTKGSKRDVAMLPPVRDALMSQRMRTQLLGNMVFANRRGEALNEAHQGDDPWRLTLLRAGVPHRVLYNLRHSYTSFMLAAGKPIQWIASQLGHKGIRKIDEIYVRWVRTPADKMLDREEFFARIAALPSVNDANPDKIPTKREAKIGGHPKSFVKSQPWEWSCPGRESNPDLRFRRPP